MILTIRVDAQYGYRDLLIWLYNRGRRIRHINNENLSAEDLTSKASAEERAA